MSHAYVVVCANKDNYDLPVAVSLCPERAEQEKKAFAEREKENPYWKTDDLQTFELPVLE